MSTATAVAGTTTITLADATLATNGANLACLGPRNAIAHTGGWSEITYRVNGGNLERCDLATEFENGGGDCSLVVPNLNFVPSVAGIVNLQVQYGISAAGLISSDPNFNFVTQWVDASGGTWSAPTVVNRNRIKGIRIAVVARNAKIEPAIVTTACSSTTAAAPTGLCAWDATSATPAIASPAPAIDLSAGDPDWLRYRYRVFETIIPLRNLVWARETL
jgi:type IV pilus assembly protein PilW